VTVTARTSEATLEDLIILYHIRTPKTISKESLIALFRCDAQKSVLCLHCSVL